MLMDAERIEREIQSVRDVRVFGKLVAFAFHQPEELDRMDERLLNGWRSGRSTLTPEDLIAIALERQRQLKAEHLS